MGGPAFGNASMMPDQQVLVGGGWWCREGQVRLSTLGVILSCAVVYEVGDGGWWMVVQARGVLRLPGRFVCTSLVLVLVSFFLLRLFIRVTPSGLTPLLAQPPPIVQFGFGASSMADGASGGGLPPPSTGLGRSKPPQAPPSATSSSSASSSSASVTAGAIAADLAQAVTNADQNAEAPSASKNGDGDSSGRASRSRSRDALPTDEEPPPPPPQDVDDDAAQAKP